MPHREPAGQQACHTGKLLFYSSKQSVLVTVSQKAAMPSPQYHAGKQEVVNLMAHKAVYGTLQLETYQVSHLTLKVALIKYCTALKEYAIENGTNSYTI